MSKVIRYKQQTYDVLYSSLISTYPSDIDVARKYTKFLREHPDINEDEIDIHIDREVNEYNNDVIETLKIIKRRPETDDEYNKRVAKEEKEIIDKYTNDLGDLVDDFSDSYCGYSDDEAMSRIYRLRVYEMINNIVKKTLKIDE